MARLLERYLAMVHWFIPECMRTNPLTLSRAQNVVSAAAIAGVSDPFYAFFYSFLDFKAAVSVILISGTMMVSAPLLLKFTKRIKIAETVFVSAVFYNFSWLTYHLGGVEAPTAAWLIVCPIVAMLLGGVLSGLFWLFMSCASIVTIYSLDILGHKLPVSPIANMLLLQTVCGVGLFVVVIIFVLFFELTKTQGFVKLERALTKIQELAIRDELTGAFNRRHLLNLIESCKEGREIQEKLFCICILDIDHFKQINDSYGHSAGDAVLKTFAKVIENGIRNIDRFGRYGGEEFLLMLPETDLDQAFLLAERVRIMIESIDFMHVSSALKVTVSIGISQYHFGEEIITTINRADQALYKAKANGRNCVIRSDKALIEADLIKLEHADVPPETVIPNGNNRRLAIQNFSSNQREIALRRQEFLEQYDNRDNPDAGFFETELPVPENYDQMTLLPGRQIFRDRLSHALHRAKRHNLMFGILTLDINKFNELNHALGYDKGDEALIIAAKRIKKCLRECDTFSRWDGDEFSILIEDINDESGVHVVAQKILEEFCEVIQLGEAKCFLTLSIGAAIFPSHDIEINGLLKKADVAMLRAKALGQNIYRIYSSDMGRTSIDPLTLKSELRHALFRGELFIQYQPQVDIVTHKVIGVEALIRWSHPVLGFVAPDQFIPFAEETGLIIPIGEWVLKTACSQTKSWRDAGLPPIKIAVNLSARQLEHPDIVGRVNSIITEVGIDPSTVELEVTEGLLIQNLHASKNTLFQLRALGIKISIDDFGTGYSSLSYLSELPLDILKMDGSFVKQLGESKGGDNNAYSIVQSIILMAHSMNLVVIAEAVETEQQLAHLRAMKCDQIQGYLYSRPVHPEEIENILKREMERESIISDDGITISAISA